MRNSPDDETAEAGIDRSAATTAAARAAIEAIVRDFDMARRWGGLSAREDRARRAILRLFARFGRTPLFHEIAAESGIARADLPAVLAALAGRDLIVLGDDRERIAGAYPFADCDRGYGVVCAGQRLHAMCALDALGIGAMLDEDATIASSCAACGTEIQITTRGRGTEIDHAFPVAGVVWAALAYADACAAGSMCPRTAFFCSDEHLWSWRRNNPDERGHRLDLAEAIEVGRALFARRLAPATRD